MNSSFYLLGKFWLNFSKINLPGVATDALLKRGLTNLGSICLKLVKCIMGIVLEAEKHFQTWNLSFFEFEGKISDHDKFVMLYLQK